MAAYIQRPDGSSLYFDLTEEERHMGEADITDLPIEEGPNITDNMRPKNAPFTMRCFISNTPLVPSGNQAGTTPGVWTDNVTSGVLIDVEPYQAPVGSVVAAAIINPVGSVINAIGGAIAGPPIKPVFQVLMFPSDFDANSDSNETLDAMIKNAELLTVFTSVAEYDNMALARYELVRDANTGTGSAVDLTFQPLNIVKTMTAATPFTTEPRGTQVKDKGAKDPKPGDADYASDAEHIKDKIQAFIHS